jgi:hypothetical protein
MGLKQLLELKAGFKNQSFYLLCFGINLNSFCIDISRAQ